MPVMAYLSKVLLVYVQQDSVCVTNMIYFMVRPPLKTPTKIDLTVCKLSYELTLETFESVDIGCVDLGGV